MTCHTHRRSVAAAALMMAAVSVVAPTGTSSGGEPQRWSCQIDLQQGDTGRVEFERTDTGIEGTFSSDRRGPGSSQTPIKGTWPREVIRFVRQTAGGEESFIGIAVSSADRLQMAGRFGTDFSGIWTATCSPGRMPFDAPASGQRPPPGPPPMGNPNAAPCAIAVVAAGPRADLAKIYQLVLRGPDSLTAVKGRQPFGRGRVIFADLPPGRYVLTLDTKADVSVSITPRRHDVVCAGASVEKVFEFR
jgi:hypothetical protein